MSRKPLRIAVDAQILPGQEGGIEQVILGLVHGFTQLQKYPEEYVFIGHWQDPEWLSSVIGPNQRIVSGPRPANLHFHRAKNILGPLRKPAGVVKRKLGQRLMGRPEVAPPSVPVSDGFYEALNVDVLHLTYPVVVVLSAVPTVFSIYDLQHRHFPQFFQRQHMDWRDHVYPKMFHHAKVIVADSNWVKDDVANQYAIDPDKIYAVPLASPTESYSDLSNSDLDSVSKKYQLPSQFILYPAVTYDHKNHVRLLEALALLRDQEGFQVNLICTGTQKHYWPVIKERLGELGLESQVSFLGFVSSAELRALYRLSSVVVLPTLFEGAGLPLLEAFREEKPVACSDIAAFREYGGDAAFFFDPHSTESIASGIKSVLTDESLKKRLVKLGSERAQKYSWERTAAMYRVLYLKAAGRELGIEDEALLHRDEYLEMEPITI